MLPLLAPIMIFRTLAGTSLLRGGIGAALPLRSSSPVVEMVSAQVIDHLLHREKWEAKKPKRGDHIRTKRTCYYHHGIYVSDREVIHYNSRGGNSDNLVDAEVIDTTLKEFLRGGECEVRVYTEREKRTIRPVEGTVGFARSCIGKGGYDLVFNNCEHFANRCTFGKGKSRQVEKTLNAVVTSSRLLRSMR